MEDSQLHRALNEGVEELVERWKESWREGWRFSAWRASQEGLTDDRADSERRLALQQIHQRRGGGGGGGALTGSGWPRSPTGSLQPTGNLLTHIHSLMIPKPISLLQLLLLLLILLTWLLHLLLL